MNMESMFHSRQVRLSPESGGVHNGAARAEHENVNENEMRIAIIMEMKQIGNKNNPLHAQSYDSHVD